MGINWSAALDRLSQGLGQMAGMRFQREDAEARAALDERRMQAQQVFEENLARFRATEQAKLEADRRDFESTERGKDRTMAQSNADRAFQLDQSRMSADEARANAQMARIGQIESRQQAAEEAAKGERDAAIKRQTLMTQIQDIDAQLEAASAQLYGDPERMIPGAQGKAAEELQAKIAEQRAVRKAVFGEYVKLGQGYMPEPTAEPGGPIRGTAEDDAALGLSPPARGGTAPPKSGPAAGESVGAQMLSGESDDLVMKGVLQAAVPSFAKDVIGMQDDPAAQAAMLKAGQGPMTRGAAKAFSGQVRDLEQSAAKQELERLRSAPVSRGGIADRDARVAELEGVLGGGQAQPADAQAAAQQIASDPGAAEVRAAVDRASAGDPARKQEAADLIARTYPGVDAGEVLAMLGVQ